MEFEKSCGAVIYRKNKGKTEYLIILNKKGNAEGHWGFPKGHVEGDETEIETAEREILEEVGIRTRVDDNFRCVSKYMPKPNVEKEAVYFAAEVSDVDIELQKSEIGDMRWCDFDEAKELLTFDDEILVKADKYIKSL